MHLSVIGRGGGDDNDSGPLLAALSVLGREALPLFACLAGNDYSKFKGDGIGKAKQIMTAMADGRGGLVLSRAPPSRLRGAPHQAAGGRRGAADGGHKGE